MVTRQQALNYAQQRGVDSAGAKAWWQNRQAGNDQWSDKQAWSEHFNIDTSPSAQAIHQGPATVRGTIDNLEEMMMMYHKSGDFQTSKWYAEDLQKLYESDPDTYGGRFDYMIDASTQGYNPLGLNDWKVGQTQQFYDAETGTSSSVEPEGYSGPQYPVTEDWREMQFPKKWQQDMAARGGDVALELMAMQNAMQGRSAAVDMLEDWDTEIAGKLETPTISAQDEQEMLAMSSGTIAQSYENQRLGATHAMGMRGIDPRSGVNQELMASMRFGALQEQSRTDIGTRLQNKQINRSSLERAMGMRSGIRGGIADLIAGQPLAATSMAASAAGLISAQRGLEMGQMTPAQGALSGGLAGATAGSVVPGIGTIIGGVVGAGAGYYANKDN